MKDALLQFFEINVNSPLTMDRILFTLGLSFVLGLVILFVYRITYRGVLFNRSFGIALLMVTLVTSIVIMPISSNLVLSLGMVGALSIVRFRTALKDPLDIVYMFWAIAVGLTAGSGFYLLSIVSSLILAAIMVILTAAQTKVRRKPYLVVIRYNELFQGNFHDILPKYHLKSKTATARGFELVVEVCIRRQETRFIEQLQQTEGIISASLVRYSGDYN